jgi:hypothetical protein
MVDFPPLPCDSEQVDYQLAINKRQIALNERGQPDRVEREQMVDYGIPVFHYAGFTELPLSGYQPV